MDKLFILFVVVGVVGFVLALLTALTERDNEYIKRVQPERRARKAKGSCKWVKGGDHNG